MTTLLPRSAMSLPHLLDPLNRQLEHKQGPLLSFLLPPMQTCRPVALNVPPTHLPLNLLANTMLSPNDSPQTSHSHVLPTKVFPNLNRESLDSWNSSIHNGNFAIEWKPEHIQRVHNFTQILMFSNLSPLLPHVQTDS